MPRTRPAPKPRKAESYRVLETYRVEIPGYHPISLNQLLGNPFKAARLKKKDAETVGRACCLASVPRVAVSATEAAYRKTLGIAPKLPTDPEPKRRRVKLEITLAKGQRRCDSDNLWKGLMDSLVNAGMLVDDNPVWCGHEPDPVYRRAKANEDVGTVIILEDIE